MSLLNKYKETRTHTLLTFSQLVKSVLRSTRDSRDKVMDERNACHLAKNSENSANSILAATFICNTLTEIFTTFSHQHYLLRISTLPHTVKSHTQYGFIYFGTQGTEFQSVLSLCSWERNFSSWRCVIYAYRDKFTWSENECVSSATVSSSTDYLNCTSLSCSEFTSNVITNTCIISLSPYNCTLLLSVHPSITETSVIRLSFLITL